MKSNIEVIQDVIEQVVNQKKLEVYDQYFSEEYISRGDPSIGMGFSVDSAENKHIFKYIAPGSPAKGKFQTGDELLWAEGEHQRWATYEEIKQGFLRGSRGSTFKLGVRRGDETLEIELTRGMVKGYDTPRDQAKANLQEFMGEEFPDLKASIKQILADGEMVVALLEYRGTHAELQREAVWREAWFVRFFEGKIVEDWTVFNGSDYFRQLGYKLVQPED